MEKKNLFWMLLIVIMLIFSIGVFSVLQGEISITVPVEGSYHKENFMMDVTITHDDLSSSDYTITDSSENVEATGLNDSIEGSHFDWSDEVDVSTLDDDTYTLTVSAEDSENNSASKEVSFVVDKTLPVLSNAGKTPAEVYSDTTVVFSVDVTEENVDSVLIEGDWTGSWANETLTLDSGETFTFSLTGELSVNETVNYKFYASDLAGNEEESELLEFTVLETEESGNSVPSVDITSHSTGDTLEWMEEHQFNSVAEDEDEDNLTFSWDFGDGNSSTEQNPLKLYDTLGEFTITLTVDDGTDTNSTSIAVNVSDTEAPEEQTITFDDELDGEQYTVQEVTATFFDLSGISSLKLFFDGSLVSPISSDEDDTTWTYSWNITLPDDLGSESFVIEAIDNLDNDENNSYSFSIIGCGDDVVNGLEDCDGSNYDGGDNACSDWGNFDGGTLNCGSDCNVDTSSCTEEDDTSDDTSDSSSSSSSGSGGSSSSGDTITTTSSTTTTISTPTSETISIIDEESSEEELGSEVLETNNTSLTEDNESKGFLTGMISRELIDNIKNFSFSELKLRYKVISGILALAVLVSLIFFIFIKKRGIVSFKEKSGFVKERLVGGFRYMFRKEKKEKEEPVDQELFKPEKKSKKSK